MSDVYRSAASIVLLRPASVCSPESCGIAYQVLLLHKPRKKDDWQLPQGGVEAGETIEQAALRELMEEAGVSAVKMRGKCTEVYKYDFPPSFRRFRPDHVCGQEIEYVFALAAHDTKVKVDNVEIDGHLWADPAQLHLYIHRKEYLDFVTDLIKKAEELANAAV